MTEKKSSDKFVKAFLLLQLGKTATVHSPAAQSEDTKNFILQASSRPGALNHPFSGKVVQIQLQTIKHKLMLNGPVHYFMGGKVSEKSFPKRK